MVTLAKPASNIAAISLESAHDGWIILVAAFTFFIGASDTKRANFFSYIFFLHLWVLWFKLIKKIFLFT